MTQFHNMTYFLHVPRYESYDSWGIIHTHVGNVSHCGMCRKCVISWNRIMHVCDMTHSYIKHDIHTCNILFHGITYEWFPISLWLVWLVPHESNDSMLLVGSHSYMQHPIPRYHAFPTHATMWHISNMCMNVMLYIWMSHVAHMHDPIPRYHAFPTHATIWHISYMCHISTIWHSATLPRYDIFPTCATIWAIRLVATHSSMCHEMTHFLHVPQYDALPRYDIFPAFVTKWRISTMWHISYMCHDMSHTTRGDSFIYATSYSTIWRISYMCQRYDTFPTCVTFPIWHSATLPRCDTFPTCATITSHTARGDSFLNMPRYNAFLCGSCLYGMPCGNGTIATWHHS